MKGMKGKLLNKLKSIKPIEYLKQDRVLLVNAADGFIETTQKIPSLLKSDQTHFVCKEREQENVNDCSFLNQEEPDVIDVAQLMRDLEEEDEMELDNDDKENVGVPRKGKDLERFKDDDNNVVENSMKLELKKPLSEIDILSFRRPDLNSGSLFDPNLLVAFEEAVKEHIRMSEAERQARIEQENVERRKIEAEMQVRIELENPEACTEARIEQENLPKSQEYGEEVNSEMCEEEPPLKTRRIEEDIDPLLAFEERCPPGGSDSVVFYTTTLRGIRKTFEDCNSIRFLLESFRVLFFERDISMHTEFKEELWRVLDCKAMPPRLFIKGRYIGGAEEVLVLHEQGKLRVLFEGIPTDRSIGPCEACAGVRFVLCFSCNGSHRVLADTGLSSKCQNCNENGLIICPLCC